VKAILESQQDRARALLSRQRVALEQIAATLLEHETVDRAELERILASSAKEPDNSDPTPGQPPREARDGLAH